MLARYLRSHCAPVRYAAPDPNSPLSLLVRSRLLSQPMQQHEGMLPMWHEMPHTQHLPGMLDALHGGDHTQFPHFLKALQDHLAQLQQADPNYQAPRYMHPELLQAMTHLYQLRAGMPGHHPLLHAYELGSLGDQAGNQAGQMQLQPLLRAGSLHQRPLLQLASSDRRHIEQLLRPLASGGGLPELLDAHARIRHLLLPHGMSGPFLPIAKLTSEAIGANVAAREQFGQAHQQAIEPRHDRPGEMLPEDYYALSRKHPRRL